MARLYVIVEGNKNLHLVSAWCRANKLVLAQEKVKEKSNEIIAIPQLTITLRFRK